MGPAVVALLFAQLAGGTWSGARPRECTPLETGRDLNVWERAKSPELRRYCDLLASGAAKIAASSAMAREVVALADDAERTRPGRAAPRVLKGRALAQLGQNGDAYALFTEGLARDPRALDDPAALLAWARVLARTKHGPEALDAYRALLPRGSSLAAVERGTACFEAGMLSMARGPIGIDDAIVFFRQGRRDAQDTVQAASALALALALDRAGGRDEARAVFAETGAHDPRVWLARERARLLIPELEAEAHALAAVALDGVDAPSARGEWRAYVEAVGASSPWADHARSHEGGASHGAGRAAPISRPK